MATTIFVSGTFDIVHAGHVAFLTNAAALGTRLVVCLPSDRVVKALRNRPPMMTVEQKIVIFRALRMVDEVCVGDDDPPEMNFRSNFVHYLPDVLCVSEDDKYEEQKRFLCAQYRTQYYKVPKTPSWPGCSATNISKRMTAPECVPARVDLAGGWLDLPSRAQSDGLIVNCAITPGFRLGEDRYPPGAGLGGSAAIAILEGHDGVTSELVAGVGWQDPAIIKETGLCVWKSGPRPELVIKRNPEILRGKLALWWTGKQHATAILEQKSRNYEKIVEAGKIAATGVEKNRLLDLILAVDRSYDIQLEEGMDALPTGVCAARKYCGSGWGGYAMYLFSHQDHRDNFVASVSDTIVVEPYIRP